MRAKRYISLERQKAEGAIRTRRFLHIPELRNAEKWKFVGVITNPFFKHGPLLQFQNDHHQTCMINRQLFYMMMTNRMEMEK
jgi:hypothetical protein